MAKYNSMEAGLDEECLSEFENMFAEKTAEFDFVSYFDVCRDWK